MSIQQEKIKAIIHKIWSKLPITQPMSGNDIVDKIDDVYEAGKNDEYNKMWDRLQKNGEQTYYSNAFRGYWWGWKNFYPKYDINVTGDGQMIFYNWKGNNENGSLKARLEECGVKLDTSKCTNINQMFAYNCFTEIPEISLLSWTTGSNLFYSSQSMESIEKIITKKEVTYVSWFSSCSNLKYIRFEGEIGNDINFTSSPLDKESIINVIEHSCTDDDVTGQTVTFRKSAVNVAFGIDIDDESTYTDEWNALRNSKSNWTFSFA